MDYLVQPIIYSLSGYKMFGIDTDILMEFRFFNFLLSFLGKPLYTTALQTESIPIFSLRANILFHALLSTT